MTDDNLNHIYQNVFNMFREIDVSPSNWITVRYTLGIEPKTTFINNINNDISEWSQDICVNAEPCGLHEDAAFCRFFTTVVLYVMSIIKELSPIKCTWLRNSIRH